MSGHATRKNWQPSSTPPVLGIVPRLRARGAVSFSSGFRAAAFPERDAGRLIEACRILRTNIKFAALVEETKTILVTSSVEKEGKSFITASLALSMAQDGKRVMMIDADMRRPSLHRTFGVHRPDGPASGRDEAVHIVGDPLLPMELMPIVGSGPIPDNPTEILGTPEMARLLKECKSKADIILVDSPPVLVAADAPVLATLVDGVILLVDPTTTRMSSVLNAKRALDQVPSRMLGIVFNKIPLEGHSPFSYYYDNYSYYGYGHYRHDR